ncbi:Multimodular transpeptidase-transglycosylase (EC (EC [Olavius sp. associated proteobacterium Delta 1]|nr:Multimodular transpeptidase-transglycosylase (EC (EC [Olavius sp. associated proteobacterium Delta 1]
MALDPVETIMVIKTQKRWISAILLVVIVTAGAFIWQTHTDLLPLPGSLAPATAGLRKVQVLDRNYIPLTVTYQNRWNFHDHIPLHEIPGMLQQAFVVSEDQRFFRHGGVDWQARLHALWQNLGALRSVRGASTISEQVIRMWHPRPRTPWSRWLEGLEAARLEKSFSKGEILEFYLNQVPYAAQRRGVVQAARYFFDRDPDTLSTAEIMALVVMVRAPSRLDVRKNPAGLIRSIQQLAGRLLQYGIIDNGQYATISVADLRIREAAPPVRADHFVQNLYQPAPPRDVRDSGRLRTTLDAGLQRIVQTILDHRLKDLKDRGARNGAALIVDHQHSEVLAWVNSGAYLADVPASWIDAVTTPRQPGSTLKPLLYALALEKGWTAATMLEDYPLSEPVGRGLHSYQNYSRTHYGPLRVREALGNSLNIPALRAIQFVGVDNFLDCLHALAVRSLQHHPDYYGDGLALGNGEITLLELVRAYTVLARQGIYRPLQYLMTEETRQPAIRRVFSAEIASLIGNILSDPQARRLEFGNGSLLRFPVQTAVKTGTSSDYRDAWAVGFNHRFTVGIWIGNLDHQATDGISGSNGPALILRSVMAELNRYRDTRPLYLSPRLVKAEICRDSGRPADGCCASLSEWFVPGTEPQTDTLPAQDPKNVYLQHPTQGMQLAMDPRIPADWQAFMFKLANRPHNTTVDWYVDEKLVATTSSGEYLWALQPGIHSVNARLRPDGSRQVQDTPHVSFTVK